MKEFSDASVTIQFIELLYIRILAYIGFDIFNTRCIISIIFKKALSNENIQDVKLFTEK